MATLDVLFIRSNRWIQLSMLSAAVLRLQHSTGTHLHNY